MSSGGLILLGVIIMVGMFALSQVILTPQQREQARLASDVCESDLGRIGQALDSGVAEDCNSYRSYSQIVAMEFPAYIFGLILIVLGLATGGNRNKNVINVVPQIQQEFDTKPTNKQRKGAYCSKCGSKNKAAATFCGKCGAEL